MSRDRPFKAREDLDGRRWKKLGPAERLLDFLKDRQTAPNGDVWYHKEISYTWIRSKIPHAPPERTLKRWMQRLREAKEATVTRTAYGMRIRLERSRKWAQQGNLFPTPAVVAMKRAKPVEKPVQYDFRDRPKVAPEIGQKWPTKEALEKTERTGFRSHEPRAVPSPEWNQQQKAKRLLREIATVHETYAGVGPGDPDGIARRDHKLEQLYEQLREMGFTDGRPLVNELAKRKAFG